MQCCSQNVLILHFLKLNGAESHTGKDNIDCVSLFNLYSLSFLHFQNFSSSMADFSARQDDLLPFLSK